MSPESKKQQIELLKQKNKDFKKQIKERVDGYNSTNKNPFTEQYEQNKSHDKLMDICISAFTKGNPCCDKLNYCFISSEPLVELGIKNFDILILNHISKYAIFVECKTSISKGVVGEKYEAIDNILKKKDYLEKEIGNKIDCMEFVFCIPSDKIDVLVRQIENVEKVNKIDSEKDPIFLIWHVNRFLKKPILQLFESKKIKTRKNDIFYRHKDKELTELLRVGVEVESEFVGEIYPSSHPCKQGRAVIAKIISENDRIIKTKEMDSENISKLRKIFGKQLIYDYFKDKKTLTHYNEDTIGMNLADRFLRESEKFGIIEPFPPDMYELKIPGEGLDTILSNYEKKYKEEFLEEYSEEEVFDEFTTKYKQLF